MLAVLMEACFNDGMRKSTALARLGPTITELARAVGVTASAARQWPDPLPPRIEDRVLAALARRHLPPELLSDEPLPPGFVVQRSAAEAQPGAIPSAEPSAWPLMTDRRGIGPLGTVDLPKVERRAADQEAPHVGA
jgi:hypothetical protein